MAYKHSSQLIVSLKKHKSNNPSIHLQHAKHQLSLDGAGLHGLDADSVDPVAIILRIYVSLQVKRCFIRKGCQLRIDLILNDRLQKPIAKMNSASWIALL
jgi:hypothetical protein